MAGSGEKWKKAKPSKYSIEDGKLVRKGKECPKCREKLGIKPDDTENHIGVFMGEHSDRKVCGKCGHSITDDSE